jgi:hypothetical protein
MTRGGQARGGQARGGQARGGQARVTDAPVAGPGALDWLGVLVLVLCGLLSGLLDALLVPLYAGSVIVPLAVVTAVVGNVALPTLARMLVPRGGIAALPFVGWLIVVVVFGSVARPEGDVILPGAPGGAKWVSYGMLLLGTLAGAGTLLLASNPARPPAAPTRDADRTGRRPKGGRGVSR